MLMMAMGSDLSLPLLEALLPLLLLFATPLLGRGIDPVCGCSAVARAQRPNAILLRTGPGAGLSYVVFMLCRCVLCGFYASLCRVCSRRPRLRGVVLGCCSPMSVLLAGGRFNPFPSPGIRDREPFRKPH